MCRYGGEAEEHELPLRNESENPSDRSFPIIYI